MAGLRNCCRKLLIYNTSRLINRNGIFLQPSRSRHHLVFQISAHQNRVFFQNSKVLFNSDRQQLIFRLASTNVNKPKTETATESVESNSSAGVVSNSETEVVQSSNSNVIIDESTLPSAPVADVNEVPVMEFISTGLKEPSFGSLGLGSWWPPGIIQQILEYSHIHLDLPWWQAIIAMTLATRILLFPVNVSIRRDTINLTNCLPEISQFQKRISDAKMAGDYYGAAAAAQEMQTFLIEKKVNLLSFLKTVFIQGPVFFCMFYALKGMANAPVESLKTGGLFWFTDLTEPDPYYLLPLTLATTLFCVLEFGAEGNPAQASTAKLKWFMRVIPVIVLFASTRFSSCVTFYWTISNFIVLSQVGLMKIPAVAKFLRLPKAIKHDPSKLAMQKKGFIQDLKSGFNTAKITAQIEDRERLNEMQFQKAGVGPIPRTFKKNPVLKKK